MEETENKLVMALIFPGWMVSVDDKWFLLRSGFLPQFVSHVVLAYGEGARETE